MATYKVNYGLLQPRVDNALRAAFPEAALYYEAGYMGRVHAKVVSPRFNGLSEKAKQRLVWDVLEQSLGPDAQDVALVMTYGMDELP